MTDLFEDIQTLATKFLRKNKDLDYIKLLDELRDIMGDSANISLNHWCKGFQTEEDMYCTFTRKVLPLPEKVISGFGDMEYIDKHHFIIEVFRTPLKEEATLFNLLKISFYCGLLLSNLKVNDLPEGIVKAYRDLKMHNLINFVSRKNYNEALEQLPKDLDKDIITQFAEISRSL